jgi:NitT/TauT family transport system substrate-binding protein
MKLVLSALVAAVALVLPNVPARGATPAPVSIVFGYPNSSDCVAAFVAKEEGFFAKRGLDVEMRAMQNSASAAAAIVSGALTASCNTPPVLLQAVDKGVGLVAIAGASATSKNDRQTALLTSPASGIKTAADLVGKKIGVSGIGSNGYVMVNQYLAAHQIDFKRVSYFEVPFSTQYALLQRGTVDAVVSAVPFLTQILDDKVGLPFEYLEAAVPEGTPLVIYISSGEWAGKNPAVLAAIRGALADGTKFALSHQDKALEYCAQYTKQALAVVQQAKFSIRLTSNLTADQLGWWVNAMTAQGLTHSGIVPANAIAK